MADDEVRLQFLYASIVDLEDTIRALDTKASLLLVVLALPTADIATIAPALVRLSTSGPGAQPTVACLLVGVAALSWGLALLCTLATVFPRRSRDGDFLQDGVNGCFHLGMQDTRHRRSLSPLTRRRPHSHIQEHVNRLPNGAEAAVRELAFEQAKLGRILSAKIDCVSWAYGLTLFWLLTGGALAALYFVAG